MCHLKFLDHVDVLPLDMIQVREVVLIHVILKNNYNTQKRTRFLLMDICTIALTFLLSQCQIRLHIFN